MSERPLNGSGSCEVHAPIATVWAALLDPATLQALIPGVDRLEAAQGRYDAWLSYGAGRIRSNYHAALVLSDVRPPVGLTLAGQSEGGLGWGRAEAFVELAEAKAGLTTITWQYAGTIGGPVAMLGGFVLRSAARVFVGRFFEALRQRLER